MATETEVYNGGKCEKIIEAQAHFPKKVCI